MTSPLLIPLAHATDSALAASAMVPSAWVQPQDELFIVTQAGTFGDNQLFAGDVVLCRGQARSLDHTVLAPVGRGQARLGTVHDTYLAGPHGEPCSPNRWRVAGRLHAVFPGVSSASLGGMRAASALNAAPARQLSLFPQAA